MSVVESDDEFVFATNTPNINKKTIPSTTKTRGINNNRAEAGPSRTVNATASNKRKKGTIVADQEQSDNDEVEEVVVKRGNPGQNARGKRKQPQATGEEEEVVGMVEEGDEETGTNDVEEINPPPTAKVRGGSKRPASRTGPGAASSGVNGSTKPTPAALAAAAAKSKGKQKAKIVPIPKKSSRQDPEPMDVDAEDAPIEDMDMEDMERDAAEGQTRLAQAINKSGRSGGIKPEKVQHPPPQKRVEHISRLEKQLQQAQEHIKDLTRQLDELNQVRRTEPEQLMERMEVQYQTQIEVKDNLLNDLKAELAKRDPLLRSGKKSAFELLTREEANNEMQSFHKQIKAYQDAIQDRDKRFELQQKEIATLQEDKRILDLELKEEVRRAKELSARQPPTSSRSRAGAGGVLAPSQDPKYAQIINFYEDLTNVIVPNMKLQPGRYLDTDEWILNCCYTHKDVVNKVNTSPKSRINFTLRLCNEPRPGAEEPIANKADLVPSVHYTPLELHRESQEFVESLGFLGDNFTFERDQLSLFVRTLHDYVSGEGNDAKSEGDSDDSVQIVE